MATAFLQNGHSPFHIVTSVRCTECERFAATELQRVIYLATGVLIPYFGDGCPKRGPEILLGVGTRETEPLRDTFSIDGLGEEGFLLQTVGEDILITGNTSRGTLYGAYAFLERFFGYRAYTREVEKTDAPSEILLPSLSIREVPDFSYRDAFFRFAFDGVFAAKCRFNSSMTDASAATGGREKFFNWSHSFNSLVPQEVYFTDHPEYFALWEGERNAAQPCLSHPDVRRIALAQLRTWIEENPTCRIFSVAQNDSRIHCTCPACAALDEAEGSPAASVLSFVNELATAIAPEYPDKLLHTFAYQYSRRAPKTIRPAPNVIVRLCNIECSWGDSMEEVAQKEPEGKCAEFLQNITDWGKITERLHIWDYAVNFRNYLQPFPCYYTMAQNIRMYRDRGVRGLLEEGNFSFGGGAAMDDLKVFLLSRLLWNADTEVEPLIVDFCHSVFGNGAPFMLDYIHESADWVRDSGMRLYDSPDVSYLTPQRIARADALFTAALQAAENEAVYERIRREYLSVRFLKTVWIEDDAERAKSADALLDEIHHFHITEIMERQNLDLSMEFIKRGDFTRHREGAYTLYYALK